VAAWLVVATGVGVLIGRVIRQRDRQVPTNDAVKERPPSERGSSSEAKGRRRR
jgi:hypothetical protein